MGNPIKFQVFLDCLDDSVSLFGMRFSHSKCRMLLQDWVGSKPNLALANDELGEVDRCIYLSICISPDGGKSDKVPSHMQKVFTSLRHLWRRSNTRLSIRGRVYTAAVRSILLSDSEIWRLKVEDVRKFSVFEHRFLLRIGRIYWKNFVRNSG